MNIVLRKYRGILTPMLHTRDGRSFGAGAPPSSILATLTSPLFLAVVAIVALILYAITHGALGGIQEPGAMFAFAAIGNTALVEQREELHSKQKLATEVLEFAGKDLDFSNKTVLERLGATDAADATAKFRALNREAEALGAELARGELKLAAQQVRDRNEDLSRPADRGALIHPTHDGDGNRKTFGQLYIGMKEFGDSRRTRTNIPTMVDIGVKTLFQTSAGFAPESVRSGLIVPAVTRPIQVLDLIPTAPINQAVEKYMEQTTRTHSAAERAEAAAYAESAFVYTERTSSVRSIGDSIPVTDEQLEDESQVAGLLDQQLQFGCRQRLDLQVLVGDGTAPNLRGINNVVGVQTQAKGTDPTIATFLKALKNVRVTGRAHPNGAVMHPNDWLDILLTQNANGDYLFGNPFMGAGPQSLFGVPVAQADSQTENTGLVGDFANFCRIGERKGVEVEIGYVGTQFTEGKKTIRATLRACFTVYRPTAFCQLTGI